MHQSIDSRPGRHPDNSISVSVHARTHTALHCTALRRTSKSMHFNGTTVHTCAFTSAVQRVCINRPLQSARPYIYRQACAKRSHAGIVFTQWSKNRFFCPTGATLCPGKREIWHGERCQISGQKCGSTAPKTVKISNSGHKLTPQGSLVCTIFTKFSAFVRVCRWILRF